jgi:hypothetical protein
VPAENLFDSGAPQHFLYFLPLPQGQGSFRLAVEANLYSILVKITMAMIKNLQPRSFEWIGGVKWAERLTLGVIT